MRQTALEFPKAEMNSVGQAAAGKPVDVRQILDDDINESADDQVTVGMLDHDFRLLPETIVRFRLPGDLTEREANRFAEFIKALPFSPTAN
jgi:hypothetical protein